MYYLKTNNELDSIAKTHQCVSSSVHTVQRVKYKILDRSITVYEVIMSLVQLPKRNPVQYVQHEMFSEVYKSSQTTCNDRYRVGAKTLRGKC